MVDIHSHILPKLDDGSKNLSISLSMAKQAYDSGTRFLFATPHYIPGKFTCEKENLIEAIAKFREVLHDNNIPLNVDIGQEIYVIKSIEHYIDRGDFSSLGNSDYYLLELPMLEFPDYIRDSLYEINISGKHAIIAHPERYIKVIKDTDILLPFIEDNVLFQMNSGSIAGIFGNKVQATAYQLLERRMISFVGSDAHNIYNRNTDLSMAYKETCKLVSKKYADQIFFKNAKFAILENNFLEPYKILKKSKKHFFKKYF